MPSPGLGYFGAIRADPPAEAWTYPRVPRISALPQQATLPLPTAVHDQGRLGSCVGQAFSRALEIEVGTGLEVSALAVYYDARIASGFPANQDTGAFMEPAIQSLASYGAGSESLWPYDIAKFSQRPPLDYRRQALDHRVLAWYRARGVDDAKSALAAGHACVTAFDVPSSFDEVGRSGEWIDRGGSPVGGHAVLMFGYDDDGYADGSVGGAFKVMNSWGSDWGNAGWFWLPYSAYAPGGRFWDSVVMTLYDEEAGG